MPNLDRRAASLLGLAALAAPRAFAQAPYPSRCIGDQETGIRYQ
jgi:hypothetical protein